MSWASAADFWAMGGYGLYVWGSLGMCALVLVAEVVAVKRRRAAVVNGLANGDFDPHAALQAEKLSELKQ